jgi:hypothetical protein
MQKPVVLAGRVILSVMVSLFVGLALIVIGMFLLGRMGIAADNEGLVSRHDQSVTRGEQRRVMYAENKDGDIDGVAGSLSTKTHGLNTSHPQREI